MVRIFATIYISTCWKKRAVFTYSSGTGSWLSPHSTLCELEKGAPFRQPQPDRLTDAPFRAWETPLMTLSPFPHGQLVDGEQSLG